LQKIKKIKKSSQARGGKMKKLLENVGAYIIALLMVASFYGAMLYTGIATKSLVMLIGVAGFALYISFTIKKKSIPATIAGFTISTVLFYGLWLFNSLIKYLKNLENTKIGYSSIALLVLIIFLIVWIIYKFLSGIYVIVKPDEAHVVTRINGAQSIYSGNIKGIDNCFSNHYWDFSKIKILRMFLGMIVQEIRLDDFKIQIHDVTVKSKEKAELVIGDVVFHGRVEKPIVASKTWPGEDMDIELFKEKISDIIEESTEITVIDYPIEKLVGGSKAVNKTFKKILEKRLGESYGIKITNAKLSQEKGAAVDLIKGKAAETLRGDQEVAKQEADERIEEATNKKELKGNITKKTIAEGLKAVTITNANAKAEEIRINALAKAAEIVAEGGAKAKAIKEVFKVQEKHEGVFTIGMLKETVQADASRHPGLTTLFGSGDKGIAQIGEIMAMIKTISGIDIGKKESSPKKK